MTAKDAGSTLTRGDEKALVSALVLSSFALAALPYIILAFTLICSPGYLMPFLNDRSGTTALLGLVVWEALGMWYLIRQARKGFNGLFLLKLIAVAVIFVLPLILATMLGPSLLTVIRALIW
jgi:hypothetical protein